MKKEKVFFTSIYCPPYPPKGEYPDRITNSAYKTLKEIGINNVFGHYEDSYGEEYLKEALDCYHSIHGVYATLDNYIIFFEPTFTVMKAVSKIETKYPG